MFTHDTTDMYIVSLHIVYLIYGRRARVKYEMRVAKLRVGILRVEVRASAR